jgi:hypothetical protein
MALNVIVITAGLLFLILIPIAIICLLQVTRLNTYLAKKYPGLGRTNAWKLGHLAANDAELSTLAGRVRISLYVMLAAFGLFLLSGAGIAALGILKN